MNPGHGRYGRLIGEIRVAGRVHLRFSHPACRCPLILIVALHASSLGGLDPPAGGAGDRPLTWPVRDIVDREGGFPVDSYTNPRAMARRTESAMERITIVVTGM